MITLEAYRASIGKFYAKANNIRLYYPILTKDTKGQYKLFIDQIFTVYLSVPNKTAELHNLVKTF